MIIVVVIAATTTNFRQDSAKKYAGVHSNPTYDYASGSVGPRKDELSEGLLSDA